MGKNGAIWHSKENHIMQESHNKTELDYICFEADGGGMWAISRIFYSM
jgi:hypothetical protein